MNTNKEISVVSASQHQVTCDSFIYKYFDLKSDWYVGFSTHRMMKLFVTLTFGDYDLQLMKTTKSMSNQAFDIILI